MEQSNGTIYLAQQRGQIQIEGFRSFNTFNFAAYQRDSRSPFGALQVLNDDTFAGKRQMTVQVSENFDIILLPIVGGIFFTNSLDTEGGYVNSEQMQLFSAVKGMSFEIENPYETDLVNILQIWIKNTDKAFKPQIKTVDFDLLKHKNHLIPLFSRQNTEGAIGLFDGRTDGIYTLKNPKNGVFAFVIEGAFEVQNRLLEPRDGLSLLDVTEVEFEALSNNAIILFLEIEHWLGGFS